MKIEAVINPEYEKMNIIAMQGSWGNESYVVCSQSMTPLDADKAENLWASAFIAMNRKKRLSECGCERGIWYRKYTWEKLCEECKKWFIMRNPN